MTTRSVSAESKEATAEGGSLLKNRALLALACAAFGIGTTEFVIMGLLPEVAENLRVSIPQAGALISAYALSVTIGGPLMVMATTRLPRKAALIGLMVLFTLGNLGCALAPTYTSLMVARVVTALCHATFFGVGLVVGTKLVPPNRKALAVGLIISGLTVANIIGVPLGTMLGQAAGWRAPFWAIGVLGLIAIYALLRWIPSGRDEEKTDLRREFAALRNGQIWFAVATSVMSSTSMFALFTYIAPLLRDVTGVAPAHVGFVLLLMGVGITVGNLVGARLGDWKLMPSLLGGFVFLAAILVGLAFGSAHVLAAVPLLCLWGGTAFAACALLQTRVITQAQDGPNLSSTLNQSAFNFGNAAGAWLGGVALNNGLPVKDLPWISAALALGAGILVIFAVWQERKAPVVLECTATADGCGS